ncbi:hypothetical protein, partial [Pseudomonas anguilliseptica]|uniref:hypothetical protein n=1 Tax=Pseudomonas anguilliseptica TaxID=53406 RepID=UPI0022AEF094
MTMPRLFIRVVIALGLMGWGQFTFAVDYSWYSNSDYIIGQNFSSPSQACQAAVLKRGGVLPGQAMTSSVSKISEIRYGCTIYANGSYSDYIEIHRDGDTCQEGATYNSATGECEIPEPDKCEPTIGVEVEHRHRAGEFTGAGVIAGRVDPPGSVCRDECQYAFSGSAPSRAYRFENGDPIGVFLAFKYKGNGVSCTGNESEFAQPSDGTPVVEKQSECTTKITDAEGRQRYDCQATELNIDPGNMECSLGTVGGELQCIPKPP